VWEWPWGCIPLLKGMPFQVQSGKGGVGRRYTRKGPNNMKKVTGLWINSRELTKKERAGTKGGGGEKYKGCAAKGEGEGVRTKKCRKRRWVELYGGTETLGLRFKMKKEIGGGGGFLRQREARKAERERQR